MESPGLTPGLPDRPRAEGQIGLVVLKCGKAGLRIGDHELGFRLVGTVTSAKHSVTTWDFMAAGDARTELEVGAGASSRFGYSHHRLASHASPPRANLLISRRKAAIYASAPLRPQTEYDRPLTGSTAAHEPLCFSTTL